MVKSFIRLHKQSPSLPAISLLLFLFLSAAAKAQNGSPCYKPLAGTSKIVQSVQGGAVCVNCDFLSNPNAITDASRTNFATLTNLASVAAGTGVTVRDTLTTYPAGFQAGYVVDFGSDVVTASLLSFFTIQTYNKGVLQESRSTANGLSVSLLSGSTGRVYINFPTTQAFDEVRFVVSSLVSVLSTLRIYYAMAFDPTCGALDNNGICYDQIAGSSTSVNFNAGLLNVLSSLTNAGNITDGDKSTYASLSLPLGVALLSTPPYVGVKDEERIYPAGTRAGFVVNAGSSLLSVGVLSAFSVQTYLHGQLQDSSSYTGGLLQVNGLGAGDALQEVSIVTTKPYNEVRLVLSQIATVNIGTISIYYAFESGGACPANCNAPLTNTVQAPAGFNVVNRDRDPSTLGVYTTTGTYGLVNAGTLSNTGNVVNTSLTDFATYSALVGVGAGARITVETTNGADYPANTFAGFAIASGSGLLDLSLLNSITIRLYNNDDQNPVQTITGASLLNLGLLGAGQLNYIGGKATVPFDEMEIDFNAGLLGVATDFFVYYAYVIRDDDNDGVPDCYEVCGTTGNDALDSDGDGTPNACDACNITGPKSSVIDTDNDGVVNSCDADSDNDGIPDVVEDRNGDGDPNNDDADGDGIPNYLDLDSDNDGINDLRESGISSALIASLDANGDGVIDATVAKGNNGMANAIENDDTPTSTVGYSLANTDFASLPAGDNVPDFVDLDSDNDGINDLHESGQVGILDANKDGMVDGPDSDSDGIMDSADGNDALFGDASDTALADTDRDGVYNFRDLDSDNDGVFDSKEGHMPANADVDVNGTIDGVDSDGDGIMDAVDGNPGVFGDGNEAGMLDSDGDGVPDVMDLDSDNNGIFDHNQRLKVDLDLNDDGMVDGVDTDGDGIINVAGLDNNNIFGGSALGTLPVQLAGFNAVKANKAVLLGWEIADEKAFKQYEVERSTNAIDFRTIGVIAGAGKASYTYTDNAPGNGTNYYRLKMVDNNGAFTYSAVKTIQFKALGGTVLRVAPNPVRDQYYLQFDEPQSGQYRIEISNMQGQVLYTRNLVLENQSRIDLVKPGSVPAGIHQMVIYDLSANRKQVLKIVFK
ncbi:MAG: hypothetical protein INR73_27025 [Williamsia sp.]|nr:hypothetical protein [Williamsia sp.]